jgi:hypothetical protein
MGAESSAELLEVHDIGSIEYCKVNNHACGAVELVQVCERSHVNLILMDGQRTELDETDAEAVVAAVPAEPP